MIRIHAPMQKSPLSALRATILAAGAALAIMPAAGHADSFQREHFRRAYQAYLDNRVKDAEAMSTGISDYLLAPHLQYESLRRRLDAAKDVQTISAAVKRFIHDNADTNVGERLRRQWLLRLAKERRWESFLADYTPQDGTALRCAHISARIATDPPNAIETALLDEAKGLWLTGETLPAGCAGIDDWLGARHVLSPTLIGERFDLAMAEDNYGLAMQLAQALPQANPAMLKLWPKLIAKPSKFLATPSLRQDTVVTRAIVRSGILQLARANAGKAATEWAQRRQHYKFDGADRGAISAGIALAAFRQNSSQTASLLDNVPADYVRADVQRAMIATGLRRQDWRRIEKWTQQPAAADMEALSWKYWRARSLQQRGMGADAERLFHELASERDYYGLLAAERLKQPYRFTHLPAGASGTAIAAFLERPGIRRSRELRELGFDAAAREEWNFEIAGLDRHGLIDAAAAAPSIKWHERAIATLGKAKAYDDLDMRYPLAFEELIERYADERRLEPAVMLSFIRSESAFNELARSPVGALGLMQVMPATGRHTAKSIGLTGFSTGDLLKPASNVMIGSAYLSAMLEEFDGNLAMAAAAYNAGPHRVRKWRPASDCLDADVWVDMIPFTETRKYARNILFGTALYQMRLKEEVKPLRDRVAVVHAANTSAGSCKTNTG
jgi:soluble lytic murein transglycosylase